MNLKQQTDHSLKIREFLPGDIDAIYLLETKCFRKELQLEYHRIVEMLQHPDVVAFVIEGPEKSIIGTFYLKVEKFINQLWILGINIDPEWRRQGVGRMALEAVFSMSRYLHIREIRAQFDASNDAALQFFTFHGFEPIRNLEDFFAEGNQGIEVSKHLHRNENS